MRPRRIEDCVAYLDGWRRLIEQVDFPVYFETHRDRMTTDLFFTLDLLDCFPDLQLLAICRTSSSGANSKRRCRRKTTR